VVVDVDAGLDGFYDERRIILQSRAVLPDGSEHQLTEQFDEIAQRFGCRTKLVVLEEANSIVLYFICFTLAALINLRDQWRSLQLRATIESLFTLLLDANQSVRVRKLSWPLTEYERSLQFFSTVQGK